MPIMTSPTGCIPDQEVSLMLSALKLSAEKHRRQRRKDAEATPYINHPIEVAELLWRVGEIRDIRVIVAGLLHDIIEDTMTGPEEIERLFGAEVLSLVLEVTDDKSLPSPERKRLQIEKAPGVSSGAKLIKIADKICNVRDIVGSPPLNWPVERKVAYLDWAARVVEGLKGCNGALEALAEETLREARTHLE